MNTPSTQLIFSIVFSLFFAFDTFAQNCNCIIELDVAVADGSKLKVAPGNTVCIKAGKRRSLKLVNFKGAPGKPIKIINFGGTAIIQNSDFHYGLAIENSSFFQLTGTGDSRTNYGIKIDVAMANASALSIGDLSTNFEVDHIEVSKAGFAGIMTKTDPRCDGFAARGSFIQRDISIHDNFVHHTKGEGMYVGNSFYAGYKTNCQGKSATLFPHELRGVKIFNNRVENTGWDGIQVGCIVADCEIYGNTISQYGLAENIGQMSGIQINSGTVGKCYNNMIRDGKGHGIVVFGLGDNVCFNNVILNAGRTFAPSDPNRAVYGIFCDDRDPIPGKSFHFVNNTIVNPKTEGIRLLSTLSTNNKVCNNIIINPGAYREYLAKKNGQDPYINIKNGAKAIVSNNFCDTNWDKVLFADPSKGNFTLRPGSPAIDSGVDLPELSIGRDFYNKGRKAGSKCDMGACEFVK